MRRSREIGGRGAVGKQVCQSIGSGFNGVTGILLSSDVDDRNFAPLVGGINQCL